MKDKRIKAENIHRAIRLRNKRRYLLRYGNIQAMLRDLYKSKIKEAVKKEQKSDLKNVDLLTDILNLYDGCSFFTDKPRNPNKNTSSKVERNVIMMLDDELDDMDLSGNLNIVSLSDEEIAHIAETIKKDIAIECEMEIKEASKIKELIYSIKDIRERQIMIKRYIDGLMYKEIADDLEKSVSYVMKKNESALEKIQMPWLDDLDE